MSLYTDRFVETVEVSTAREIFAWTETHDVITDAAWVPGYRDEPEIVCAVPVPGEAPDEWPHTERLDEFGHRLVAFIAASEEDADRIRESVF